MTPKEFLRKRNEINFVVYKDKGCTQTVEIKVKDFGDKHLINRLRVESHRSAWRISEMRLLFAEIMFRKLNNITQEKTVFFI